MMHTCGAGLVHHGTAGQVRRWQAREALAQGANEIVVRKAHAHDDYLDGLNRFRERALALKARLQGAPDAMTLGRQIGVEDTIRLLDECLLESWKANSEERHGQE